MDKKKAAAAAAVTVAAATGMVTGTVFESPADLMGEPAAIVSVQADEDDGGICLRCEGGLPGCAAA